MKSAFSMLFLILLASSPSWAAADTYTNALKSKTEQEESNKHYPSDFQITVLGGMALGDLAGPAAYGDSAESYKAGVLVDYGRGWFGAESGVELLAFETAANISDPSGQVIDQRYRVNSQWVGIPLVAKYNYIEHPQASFSLKLGVEPAFMITRPDIAVTASDSQTSIPMYGHLNTFDAFGVGGFTGVAPISSWVAFVLDGTFYYGMADADGSGAHNKAFFLSAGFRFNL